jgi:hypothetical protein
MKKMLYVAVAILVIVNVAHSTPLLWRGPKTAPKGKPVFMLGLAYSKTDQSYSWTDEEWQSIPSESQTTSIPAHLMLGYAPIKNWEIMAHAPVMYKSRDTLSSFGLQDIWLKTRYNFVGGKTQHFLTGVAAVRLPTASEDADILLDDRTVDFALGALYMFTPKPVLVHIKAGYWLNGTKETAAGDVNVGDMVEVIFKPEYVFNPKVKAFLNFTWLETFKSKDADGNDIDNSEKRRLNIVPGLVAQPVPGMKVRPKVIIPITAVCKGGSVFTWKIGLDIWYIP